MIYTHKIKNETQTIIRYEINLIKTRFDEKMIFFRIDEKKSLDDNFKKFIVSLKILYKFSSSDTSIQNDYSEKKNYLLIMKTKTLSIEIELFQYF